MKKHRELPEVEPVRLKPVFGIRPGVYLLVLYTIIIVLCIFLVCFLPGIVKGGRFVHFSFPVSDAGLEIDGVYQGAADYQYFVPSGTHTVKVSKADQTLSEQRISVDHPLFLTWLIHYHQDASIALGKVSDQAKQAVLRFDLQEIARYSTVKDYDLVTVYPPLYANLVRDMQALGIDDSDALDLAAQFIGSKEMLDEAGSLHVSFPLFQAALDAADRRRAGTGLPDDVFIDIAGLEHAGHFQAGRNGLHFLNGTKVFKKFITFVDTFQFQNSTKQLIVQMISQFFIHCHDNPSFYDHFL